MLPKGSMIPDINDRTWAAISAAAERDAVPVETWLKRVAHGYPPTRRRLFGFLYFGFLAGAILPIFSFTFVSDYIQKMGAPIGPAPLISFNDGRESIIGQRFEYRILNTQESVTVPEGFVTDLASTPRIIWALLPPFGSYQKAAIVHDYLYWTKACTREQADKIFWLAMFESGVGSITSQIVYSAVRKFGGNAWNKNARERGEKRPRFVPAERIPMSSGDIRGVSSSDDPLTIKPLDNWSSYRSRLAEAGIIIDPGISMTSAFCTTADDVWSDIDAYTS